MNLNFDTIYRNINQIIKDGIIDLSSVRFVSPWAIVMLCLLLIEKKFTSPKADLVLPRDNDLLCYLKRMHLDNLFKELGYDKAFEDLNRIEISEPPNSNIQEILHCSYSDEFNARLGHLNIMFRNFGLNRDDANLATNIIAELGNNVFDHNLGNWPTDISGCILVAQNYPAKKSMEVAIGDPGIGFRRSLGVAFPDLKSDVEAIKKGLGGYTGRVDEKRGNGLKFVQRWTIDNFHGKLIIQSGDGLVEVDEKGITGRNVYKVLGTLVQFMIYYK